VIRQYFSTSSAALVATVALCLAQAPLSARHPQGPQRRPAEPAAASQPATTTLIGCLYREDQIPGRKPNVAERARILEDYILADASAAETPSKPATPGATGTTGTTPATGSLYKVEGPSDERLKGLVGKRVEVIGRIDPERGGAAAGGAKPDRGPGPDRISLPEIETTSIREATGTCPANPAPRK
jgi:hypothetical protein